MKSFSYLSFSVPQLLFTDVRNDGNHSDSSIVNGVIMMLVLVLVVVVATKVVIVGSMKSLGKLAFVFSLYKDSEI